jgi:hypothetical protein
MPSAAAAARTTEGGRDDPAGSFNAAESNSALDAKPASDLDGAYELLDALLVDGFTGSTAAGINAQWADHIGST